VKSLTVTKYFRAIAATLLACVTTLIAPAQTLTAGTPPHSDSLTLEAATEQFLRRNLAVEAARLEVGVAEAERVGARLRPRPGLTVTAENLQVSGETPFDRLYEVGFVVAQPIELGNRSGLRAEVAERTVTAAGARLTEVLQRRLFDLKRTYYEAALARALLLLERENRDNFAELVRLSTARFEEGDIAEGELIKVRLERIKVDSAVANADLTLRQANVRLLEMLGGGDYGRAETMEVAARMEGRTARLDLAGLRQAALANRAEVRVAEAEAALSGAVTRLERSRGKGEITPSVGYRRWWPASPCPCRSATATRAASPGPRRRSWSRRPACGRRATGRRPRWSRPTAPTRRRARW
jgi:outer membrane protein TolC